MCGLSGITQRNKNQREFDAFIKASRNYLKERGPDDFICLNVKSNFSLMHSRLSIIDIKLGHQPMEDDDGVVAFNGEIYNFNDIKSSSQVYKTNSDTEVLLKGIAAEGLSFLKRADGMFAFCYFNKKNNEITLARDAFGIKPLYYIANEDVFAFSSRLQPLMLFSEKQINKIAFAQYYLTRSVESPNTIFCDVLELKAGYALTFCLDSFVIKSVTRWAEPFAAKRTISSEKEALSSIDEALHLSVKRHLISDVPVGVFLSGGVDSSLLTAIASQYNPEINAFSVGFKNPKFDESRYAALVCQRYRLRHHVHYCDYNDLLSHLDVWSSVMDDAVADPSAVMLTVLAKFARELGYKVMLSGEGADEIFAGYNQYYRFQLSLKLSTLGKYIPQTHKLAALIKPNQSRYMQFAINATKDPYFYGTGRIFEPYLLSELMDTQEFTPKKAASLSEALDLDFEHRLPDDILTRTDRATMYASIEARVPFLTNYIVNVACSLKEDLLIRGRTQKYALKKLAEKYVPRDCIYRKKIGFDLPLAEWLRGPMKSYVLDSLKSTWQEDYLRKDYMKSVIDDHINEINDNADKLWAFVLLENNVKRLKNITLSYIENDLIA